MKIGFDAKRFFHNHRGLGNYSRDAVRVLNTYYPENDYYLLNPKEKNKIEIELPCNTREILPHSSFYRVFPALWRSFGIKNDMKQLDLDIFHGLSQELPSGIEKLKVKSIVTMHDAIFMRYPELYPATYRTIFIRKNQYACRVADRIIAISEQTKEDIIRYFNADEKKIDVVYQGCNNIFRKPVTESKTQQVKEKYNLPANFLLYVGAIEKRKNVKLIIEAIGNKKIDINLVIVGKPTAYMQELKPLIEQYQLQNQIVFLHNVVTDDLPAVYKLAKIFVMPSIFEGFGIPILEALCAGTPVIASSSSCFDEVGGPGSIYLNPHDLDAWGDSISDLLNDDLKRENMISKGLVFAENFSDDKIAHNLMNVYLK